MYRRLIKGLAASAALLSLVGCGESNLPVAVSDPVPPQGLPKILGPGPAAEGTADSFPDYRPGETSGDSLFKAGPASGTSARPLLRKPSNGSLGAWLLDKQGSLAEGVSLAATVSLDWEIKGVGDFNRDGQPDILWQHKSKRTLVVWLMNGSAYSSSVGLPTPVAGWDLRAVADFDGDGNPDLLWHHPSSNQVTYWRMNKTSVTSAVFIGYGPYTGGPWVVRTAADFFEDGRADIVWQNTVDRSLKVWKWNGAYNDAELSWPAPPAGFEVVAADDCNGDGRPDLLVQNPSSFEVGFVKVLDGVSLGYTTIGISSSARYLAGVLPPSQPAVARSSTDGNLVYGVHDPVRKRLYCSNYDKSRVDVYDEVSRKFLAPIPVGSMPLGIDLTADASRLLVCCSGANAVYSIDLTATTLAGVAIPLPPNLVGPRRPSYLACCSNGRALISSSFDIGVLEMDLASQSFRELTGPGSTQNGFLLRTSRNRQVIAVGSMSSFLYSASTAELRPFVELPNTANTLAISDLGLTIFDDSFVDAAGRVIGHAGYLAANFSSDESKVIAAKDNELAVLESGRLTPIWKTKVSGRTFPIAGSTEQRIFGLNGSSMIDITLPEDLPPIADKLSDLKVPIGGRLTLKLPFRDPEGQPLTFSAAGLPSDASLNAQTGELTFAPTGGSDGDSTVISLSASDGNCSTDLALNLVKLDASQRASFLPISGSLTDLLIDPRRGLLYASNRTRNRVERFDFERGAQMSPILVGPGPMGMDLCADLDHLVVCESLSEYLASVDLTSNEPTVTRRYRVDPGQAARSYGPGSVACSSQGLALVSPVRFDLNSGSAFLSQMDLNSESFLPREDLGSRSTPSAIRSSRDKNVVVAAKSSSAIGGLVRLNAALECQSGDLPIGNGSGDIFLSIDSSQIMMTPNLALFQAGNLLASVLGYGRFGTWNGGNFAFRHNTTSEIQIFQLPSLAPRTSLVLPAVASGRMLQTDDGRYLFVICEGGICIRRMP